MFVCVFFLHSAVGSGLLKKDEDMKTIKQTGLAVPSKRLRSCVQHRKTTEQVWVMSLTKSIFDLYSVFLIIVIFFRFIVVFQNVSALYKCSVCFSRKSQNKQAKKPSQKYNPKAGNCILGVGMAKLCLPRLLSYSQPCVQKGESKQRLCLCGTPRPPPPGKGPCWSERQTSFKPAFLDQQ